MDSDGTKGDGDAGGDEKGSLLKQGMARRMAIFIGNHGAPGGKEGHRGTLACAPAASSTTAALLPTQLGPGRSLRRGGNLSEVQPVFAWMFQYGGKP